MKDPPFGRCSGLAMRARSGTAETGFTLLEVLVAFVIAALALGVLFEGAVGGLRATRVADRTEEALSRAQSHLATIGNGVALRTTTQEGEDGTTYHWTIAITPMQSAAFGNGGASAPRLTLFRVVVTESWPEGDHTRRVSLRTERLGTSPGGGP